MDIVILQHIKIEDPGHIKDLMISDGAKLTTIELYSLCNSYNSFSSFLTSSQYLSYSLLLFRFIFISFSYSFFLFVLYSISEFISFRFFV